MSLSASFRLSLFGVIAALRQLYTQWRFPLKCAETSNRFGLIMQHSNLSNKRDLLGVSIDDWINSSGQRRSMAQERSRLLMEQENDNRLLELHNKMSSLKSVRIHCHFLIRLLWTLMERLDNRIGTLMAWYRVNSLLQLRETICPMW